MTIFNIDPAEPIPLYLQIDREVRRLIRIGALRAGDRLPPVRELATRARVNRNTAARAIQHLETAGVVRTEVGRGTFVQDGQGEERGPGADPALAVWVDGWIDRARRRGLSPGELLELLQRRIDERSRTEWSDRGDTAPGEKP